VSKPRDATVDNTDDARDQHTPPHARARRQQTGERKRGRRKRREEEEEEGKEKACRNTRHGSESREGVRTPSHDRRLSPTPSPSTAPQR